MFFAVLFSFCVTSISSINVDNEILGEPEASCWGDEMKVKLLMEKPFKGTLYVKGHFDSIQCRKDFFLEPGVSPELSVPIGDCGMAKHRINNASTMFHMTMIVKFHPQFLTKHDKAFDISCQFNRAPMNVSSSVTFVDLAAKQMMFDDKMDECDYSLRAETVEGPVATQIGLGGLIVHRWQCQNSDRGMLVVNCFAKGPTESIQVIDERGCPVSDEFSVLSYDNNLNMAFVRVESFRFPDQDAMKFDCQIVPCQKPCTGISPPNCPKVSLNDFKPNSYVLPSEDEFKTVVGIFDEPFPTSQNPLFWPVTTTPTSQPVRFLLDNTWNKRRSDQPIAEVKKVHQKISNANSDSLLLLKRPSNRLRRDDYSVKNVSSNTILVGNFTHSIDKRELVTPVDTHHVCVTKRLTMLSMALMVFLSVYSTGMTIYFFIYVYFERKRNGKVVISSRPRY